MCKEGLFVYTKSYFICIMIIGIMSLLFLGVVHKAQSRSHMVCNHSFHQRYDKSL